MGDISAWSYSRWEAYTDCARRAKYKFVDKLPEPSGPPLERGDRVHKILEAYLCNERDDLDFDVKPPVKLNTKLKQYYEDLRGKEIYVENQMAFRSDWTRTTWFAKDAWLRVMMDVFIPTTEDNGCSVTVDHKTGGVDKRTGALRDPHKYDLQMELYGVSCLLLSPHAGSARAELVFVDAGEIVAPRTDYKRKDLPKLQKAWEGRVKAMLNDTIFKPNPGDACRFCHFKKENGGPCAY